MGMGLGGEGLDAVVGGEGGPVEFDLLVLGFDFSAEVVAENGSDSATDGVAGIIFAIESGIVIGVREVGAYFGVGLEGDTGVSGDIDHLGAELGEDSSLGVGL